MLILKSNTSQNQAGNQVYIEVVNATGVYDAVNNPGGFGTPNPARNTLALVFYGNFKKVAGDVEAVPLAHDPLTVTSYTLNVDINTNGVLEYYVFAIPIFNPLGVYVDGDITYDKETPSAPFIKERVAGVWVTRTPAEIIGKTILVQIEDYTLVIPDAIKFRNALNASRTELFREKQAGEPCGDKYDQVRQWYDYVDGLLEEACNDFRVGAYNEAQIKVEAVLELKVAIDGKY